MKRKSLLLKEYENLMKPNEELSFSLSSSPFRSISLPPSVRFFAIAWHGSLGYNSRATAYVIMIENNPRPLEPLLNIDAYSIYCNGVVCEIRGPRKDQWYHWINDLPSFMGEQAPQSVKKSLIDDRLGEKGKV